MAWFTRRPRIEDLVTEHYESVYRFAYRLCGTAGEADDLTQETFCQAQIKIDQLREAAAARGWLFSIVRNAYLHRLRSTKVAKTVSLDESTEPIERWDAEPLVIEPEKLQEALNDLPEAFRTPLVLYFFEEFSYRQIADQLGVPVGTVMSRLARAKSYLRERLLRVEPALAWGRKEEA
ncbi:MAG: RNA polymerase sigma factor [Planctomycetota bacterium]|jgi:RNA polymerase sigma-70 factor (ECF subfamily)